MLCPQPCTKMAPPPCELSVIPKPSMLDGLHQKLLGNGLVGIVPLVEQLLALSNVVPVGKPARRVGSHGFAPWNSAPFDNTVIAAPSNAPISEGSCNNSAMLPLRPASHPTVDSRGNRSTCGLLAVAVKAVQPAPQALLHPFGVPLVASPNRQSTCTRHGSSLPAGWVFALRMLEAAPTPCSRTGFHISNSSLWAVGDATHVAVGAVTPAQVVPAGAVALGANVGSMMIKSPGAALSIALWIEPKARTCVGALPPIVTVTVSIDCLPLAAVITSWPHCIAEPLYCACCWIGQVDWAAVRAGTVPVMTRSPQETLPSGCATPWASTKATVPVAVPKEYFRVTVLALNGAVVADGPV